MGGKQKVCSFLIQITDFLNKRGYLSPLLRWLNNASPLHKLLGRFSAMMVKEETVGGVERSNLLHVLSIKFEVEEVQILLHSLFVDGLRDDDYVALQQSAQAT